MKEDRGAAGLVRRLHPVGVLAQEKTGGRKLAGFMLRRLADRVVVSQKNGRSTVLFHFDH